MHITRAAVIGVVVLAWAGEALARPVTAENYTVRILEPPAVHPPADCELYSGFDLPCGPGPGLAGGIDNSGNVVGPLETTFPHDISAQDMGVWLRSTGYTGENRGKFRMTRDQKDRGQVFPGPEDDARAFGYIVPIKVTSEGIVYGIANIGNGSLARYDIATDEWRSMGFGGTGAGGNNLGIMVDGAQSPGAAFGGFDGQILDTKLVPPNGPFGLDRTGVVQTLPPPFFVQAISPIDINDDNVIVGSFDDASDGMPANYSNPIKLLQDGPNHWSEDYVVMGELHETGMSRATQISNRNEHAAFAIGWSEDANRRNHGVLWNVDTTELLVDFGLAPPCRHNDCGTAAISPDGTMVVGTRIIGFGPFAERERFIAWTDDGWQTHQEVLDREILNVAPGGEHIEEITKFTGINDHGQVSAQGVLKGEFGEYLTPNISNWDPTVATDAYCSRSGAIWEAGNGCGIPLLLDTITLTQILKGDVNDDGSVDNLDITPFIAALAAEDEAGFLAAFPKGNYAAADIDMSGGPDNLDITPFIGLLTAASSNATAVPEPSSLVCIALALMMGCRRLVKR